MTRIFRAFGDYLRDARSFVPHRGNGGLTDGRVSLGWPLNGVGQELCRQNLVWYVRAV